MAKTESALLRVTIDGQTKSFDTSPWGGMDGFLQAAQAGATSGAASLKKFVPQLAKANDMTSNAVASLPFDLIQDDGTVFDTSSDWQNTLGGIPNPARLIKLIASALCGGAAYVKPTLLERRIVDLQYFAPQTVTPLLSIDGIINFNRAGQYGKAETLEPDELIYFWLPDSDIDLGPAQTHPLGVAWSDAALLFGMAGTLRTYADRQFVPPTLLGIKGQSTPQDISRTENWWNRFIKAPRDMISKVIQADTVSIVPVGAGFAELRGSYPQIVKQAIENIGMAYGIPAGLFMADKAFASEMNALIKVWYTTSQFVNIYTTIQETFTDQLFKKYGLRFVFKPETLDAFQEDETLRSQNYSAYVNAKVKPSIAAQMVGLELPEGVEFADLDTAQAEAQPITNPKTDTTTTQPAPVLLTADQTKDLHDWRAIALRLYKRGAGNCVDFECKALPDDIADGIRDKLKAATSESEISKAFDLGQAAPMSEIMALAESINRLANGQ